ALAIVQSVRKRTRFVLLLVGALVVGSGISFSTNYAFQNFLQAHQQERINMWLRPDKCDPSGPLYNVIQSKMAIGAGGLQGKGLLQGTMTKLNYVPEQSTDFIFCTIGEEQGFIGSTAVILLFLGLLVRMVILAERQRGNFARHYMYGVLGIIFFHVFVNVGMTMGLVPIIGIPLPFISKGGSSLLGFTIMIAVMLKLDSNRYYM
ncbi:MAG: rod shape-determining protein RodA, partial [Bacteroidota bacterium]